MKQQINLFRSLPRSKQTWFGHMMALQIGAGFIVLLALVTAIQVLILVWGKYNLVVLEATFIDGSVHLQKEQAALGGVNLYSLQQELATKTKMLKMLHIRSQEGQGACSMLPDYLQSLSAAQLDGLWLTKFHIEPDTRDMTLAGLTYQPILIVDWVKQLGTTPCFSEMQFHTIDVDQANDATNKDLMTFNITSTHVKPVLVPAPVGAK